jgi:hypothetical protein
MKYFFTDSDLSLCHNFAYSVNKLKANYKSTNKLSDNPHYLGKLGEAVFSKLFDLPVNFDIHHEGDNGYDFTLGNLTVDIKTTQYWRYPELKEFPNKKLVADIYVLASVNLDDGWGEVCGFISRRKLEDISPINYRNKGLRIVATTKELCRDWEALNMYAMSGKYADMKNTFRNDKAAL